MFSSNNKVASSSNPRFLLLSLGHSVNERSHWARWNLVYQECGGIRILQYCKIVLSFLQGGNLIFAIQWLSWFSKGGGLGFRYVQVPGQFYKREYILPSQLEKRARDLTSRFEKNGVSPFKIFKSAPFLINILIYYPWEILIRFPLSTFYSLNGVPMMGKRGPDAYPPYNIDVRYEE